MCPTVLFVAILALIIAPQPTASSSGYRHVPHLNGNNITPRFAEYQAPGCVDLFGNPKEDYKDYSPMVRKCYNIDIRTVSIYHERGYMSDMWLYPEYGCKGPSHRETDWSCCQPVERGWKPYHVRSFRMG
ncbi:uncharacterized protein K444DRAFT_662264 [Hyaloscypha bicolor E]|uniref:Uncharacterized protein n=1 Tax=Hyaloscypha bicolor E TaxID=1095630 RepID=A0A2J6TDI1_9HELO|nr:uncharacterized protein K444DRAFT_662264 [Hyaloscypha bicolor E]PMD61081.1 hypothetical protein K444DRAFT_662264 [Hyaloscypha bicolor E]